MTATVLLDFIARFESRGNYNIVWGGIKKQHRPPKPLASMTIGQVLAWQDSIDPLYMSEAAGKYQIMEDTLRGLYREAGMTTSSMYDEAGQDQLGVALLKRRGLDDYMSGRISAEKFANSLAKEWASLPVVSGPKKGRSYYGGDGLNKSHVSVAEFMNAVKAIRTAPPAPQLKPQTPPKKETSCSICEWLSTLFSALWPGKG
ncbi:hypothetical protein [Sulfitobacter sp. PS-8MA]|uniref:hypothetical protein n=1 Tax=Sulfitobacter sp. PS-8MA TaxID=3237707 RepID=UPI0034C6C7A2